MGKRLRSEGVEGIPEDPEAARDLFGVGWWKHDPEQAAKLLTSAGFKKPGNGWMKPDGTPWTMTIIAPADFEVESQRLAFAVANEWKKFGIPTNVQQLQGGVFFTAENTGDLRGRLLLEPDLRHRAGSLGAPGMVAQGLCPPERHRRPPVNQGRYANDKLSALIDEMAPCPSDDPKIVPLGTELLKELVTGMPVIPMFGTSKFVPVNETYWTNYPTADELLRGPVVVVVELQVHRRPPRAGLDELTRDPLRHRPMRWRSSSQQRTRCGR